MLLHRLALSMGRTVEELSDTISADELLSWRAYFEIEPFGAAGEWVRFARTMSSSTGMPVGDFLPDSFRSVDDDE